MKMGEPEARQAIMFSGRTFNQERDGERLGKQYVAVRDYTFGRGWLTLADIGRAVGAPEASVSARLRDLRKAGYTVDCKYIRRGLHEYRVSD